MQTSAPLASNSRVEHKKKILIFFVCCKLLVLLLYCHTQTLNSCFLSTCFLSALFLFIHIIFCFVFFLFAWAFYRCLVAACCWSSRKPTKFNNLSLRNNKYFSCNYKYFYFVILLCLPTTNFLTVATTQRQVFLPHRQEKLDLQAVRWREKCFFLHIITIALRIATCRKCVWICRHTRQAYLKPLAALAFGLQHFAWWKSIKSTK